MNYSSMTIFELHQEIAKIKAELDTRKQGVLGFIKFHEDHRLEPDEFEVYSAGKAYRFKVTTSG